MKQKLFKPLLLIVCLFSSIEISAYDFEVDGIYYNITSIADKTVEITHGGYYDSYSGDIIIPSTVKYQNYQFNVTGIGERAFYYSYITSVTIPNSIIKIGKMAFYGARELTSITIPNSVVTIEREAFCYIHKLTKIKLSDNITELSDLLFYSCDSLSSITIPNNVKTIGEKTFYKCINLTTVTIPNNVIEIKDYAFHYCEGLNSISIPNSVMKIGKYVFEGCRSLMSVILPNNLNIIETATFRYCSNLTILSIPNSVKSIGTDAFQECNLKSITIPNGVTLIGDGALDCRNLMEINSLAITPPEIKVGTFNANQQLFATLNVPKNCGTTYRNAEYWKEFVNIVEDGEAVETQQCEKPTISYVAGKLRFNSSTEGAEYIYTLTDSDIADKRLSDGTVNLDACYKITVYAIADGYQQSETATATLYWINADLETTNINNIKSRGIVASYNDGVISISGLNNDEQVSFYGIDGVLIGSQRSINGEIHYAVGYNKEVVIAKIGDEAIKIVAK